MNGEAKINPKTPLQMRALVLVNALLGRRLGYRDPDMDKGRLRFWIDVMRTKANQDVMSEQARAALARCTEHLGLNPAREQPTWGAIELPGGKSVRWWNRRTNSRDGESWTARIDISRADLEAALGRGLKAIVRDNEDRDSDRMTKDMAALVDILGSISGFYSFDHGPGRAFASDMTFRIHRRHVAVQQTGGLDI
jgi:hypothetical protein